MSRWVVFCLVLLLACGCRGSGAAGDAGGDGGDTSTDSTTETGGDGGDAAADADPGVDAAGAMINGRISLLVVEYSKTERYALASASFYDHAVYGDASTMYPSGLYALAEEDGDCALFQADESACNPPCGAYEYCGAGAICLPYPQAQSAGKIAISGLSDVVEMLPSEFDMYGAVLPDDPFGSGDSITAEVAGADIPGFALSTHGVDDLSFSVEPGPDDLTLVDGRDNAITWVPGGGGLVQLVLNFGYGHSARPNAVIVCEAPDGAGKLTIPRAIVEAAPAFTSGEESYAQHASWISRMSRARESLDGYLVELVAGRRFRILVNH